MSSADVESLARQLRPDPQHYLRQGVVTAITADTISVKWGNAANPSPLQRYLTGYVPRVGDSVFGLRDGDDALVLGAVTQSSLPQQGRDVLAYEILDRAAPTQPYAQNGGVVPTGLNIATSSTEGNTGLALFSVPCPPSRLLRMSFQFWAANPVAAGVEWYFIHKANFNGAGWQSVGESRYAPSGGAAGSPMGELLFVSPSNAATVSIGMNVRQSSGTGTLYQYAAEGDYRHSQFLLEDLGQA